MVKISKEALSKPLYSKVLGLPEVGVKEFGKGVSGQFTAGVEQAKKGFDVLSEGVQQKTKETKEIFTPNPDKGVFENILVGSAKILDKKNKPLISKLVDPTTSESKIAQGLSVAGVGGVTSLTSPVGGVATALLPEQAEQVVGDAFSKVEGVGGDVAEKQGYSRVFGETLAGEGMGVVFGAGLGLGVRGAAKGLKSASKTEVKATTPKTLEEEAIEIEKEIIPDKTETAENIETAQLVDTKINDFIEDGNLIESPEFIEGITRVDKNSIRQLQLRKAEPLELNTKPVSNGIDFLKVKQPKGTTLQKDINKAKELQARLRDINANKRNSINLIKQQQIDLIKDPELKKLLKQSDLQDLSIKNKKFTDLALKEAENFFKEQEKLKIDDIKTKFKDTLEKTKQKANETATQYKARIDRLNKQHKSRINKLKTEYSKKIGEVKSAAKGKETLRKDLVNLAKDYVNKAVTTGEYGAKIIGNKAEVDRIKGELLNSALKIKNRKTFDDFSNKLSAVVNKNNFRTVDNRIKAKLKTIRKQLRKTKNQTNYAGDSIFALKSIANGYEDFRKTGDINDLLKLEKELNNTIKEGKLSKAEHSRKVDTQATESADKILEEGINSTENIDDVKIREVAERDKTKLTNFTQSVVRNLTRLASFTQRFLNPDRRISLMGGGYDSTLYKVFKKDITAGYSNYELEFHRVLTGYTEKHKDILNNKVDGIDTQELSVYGQLTQNVDNTKTSFADKYAYGLKYVKNNTEIPKTLKDIEALEGIVKKIEGNKKATEAVQDFRKIMDNIYDSNNLVHLDLYGTPTAGRIKNYYAVLGSNRDKNTEFLKNLSEGGGSITDSNFTALKKGTKDGFTLTRDGVVEHKGGSDFASDIVRMMETQLYYKHLQKPIVDGIRVLDKLQGSLTEGDSKFLQNNLHYMATKGGEFQLDFSTKAVVAAGFVASTIALVFKPSTVVKQFLGYADAVEIGGHHMGIGARYTTPGDIHFARKNSAEMLKRFLGDEQLEMINRLGSQGTLSGSTGKAFSKFSQVGFLGIRAADTIVANNVWWAAINKRMYDTGRKDLSSPISKVDITKDDILYADRMVSNKLNSGAIVNRPEALQAPIERLFLTLQSTVVNRLGIVTVDTKQLWDKGEKVLAAANVAGWVAGSVGDSVITSMAALQKQVLGMSEANLTEEQKEKLDIILQSYPEEIREAVTQDVFKDRVAPEFGSPEYFKWLTLQITGKEYKDVSGNDIGREFVDIMANQIPYINNIQSMVGFDSSGIPAVDLTKDIVDSAARNYDKIVGKGLEEKKEEIQKQWKNGEMGIEERNLRIDLAELEAEIANEDINVLNSIGFFGGDIGKYIITQNSKVSIEEAVQKARLEEDLELFK